jgi:hypothetical protein
MTAGTVGLSCGSTGGPSRAYQYREAGHTWLYDWDPRETQSFVWALLDEWDTPKGEPLDGAARERILDTVWPAMVKDASIVAIIDHSPRLRCPVAVRWSRGDSGFLVDVNDGGQIDYLEVGRTMRVRYSQPEPYVAVVDWPAEPRWCEPGGAITSKEGTRIQRRLRSAKSSDMRIGYHLPWRVVVP